MALADAGQGAEGLSPQERGNLADFAADFPGRGPIPAGAGEP